MAKATTKAKATPNAPTSNGYVTKPGVGHNASRAPRKVIFGAGGNKGTPGANVTSKTK